MTNKQIAASLLELANVYGTAPDDTDVCRPLLTLFAQTKEQVIATIKAIGGKFTKHEGVTTDYMEYRSVKIPNVRISICRDRVCRKIVTYDCEPLFSHDDEAEIMEASA